jgi:hypothetical protein
MINSIDEPGRIDLNGNLGRQFAAPVVQLSPLKVAWEAPRDKNNNVRIVCIPPANAALCCFQAI